MAGSGQGNFALSRRELELPGIYILIRVMKIKILIILIVVVVLGAGGFFAWKNISIPEAEKERNII